MMSDEYGMINADKLLLKHFDIRVMWVKCLSKLKWGIRPRISQHP